MDRELKLILGIIGSMIIVLIALSNMSLKVDLHSYRLILTSEGCVYAQSIGLPVEKTNGQCSVQARFLPHSISPGGVLQLDNDKKITITDSMLLATSRLDNDLPPTKAQREGLLWFWVWMGAAIVVGGVTFYKWCRKPANKRG